MSRRMTNLLPPNPSRKFKGEETHINGMSQYLKEILDTQEEIYDGIYDQLLEEEYKPDNHNYLGVIELVR